MYISWQIKFLILLMHGAISLPSVVTCGCCSQKGPTYSLHIFELRYLCGGQLFLESESHSNDRKKSPITLETTNFNRKAIYLGSFTVLVLASFSYFERSFFFISRHILILFFKLIIRLTCGIFLTDFQLKSCIPLQYLILFIKNNKKLSLKSIKTQNNLVRTISAIFMVAPWINNIKYLIVQLMHLIT